MPNSVTRMALVACALASIVACSSAETGAPPEGVDPSVPATVDTSAQALTQDSHTQCPKTTPTPGAPCHHVGLTCPYPIEFCMQGQFVAEITCIGTTGNKGTWGQPFCPMTP
jgi:hypothetical protein